MSRMRERIDEYLAFGVPFVWVIDPRRRSADIYTPRGTTAATDGILHTDNPDLRMPLAELLEF